MSGSQQVGALVNLQRNWVKRVLKIELRSRQVRGIIDKGTNLAEPGDTQDNNTKSRKALVRRLAELKSAAIDFSAIAPNSSYTSIRGQIRAIQDRIDNQQWTEAHKRITQVFAEIQQTEPGCRKLRDLQTDIQRVTLKLDQLSGVLLPDDFEELDKRLLNLERGVSVPGVDGSIRTLTEIESTLDRLQREGEERLGRINTLKARLPAAETTATRLGVRAGELALDDLQKHAETLATQLKELASSDDEEALTEALDDAEKLTEDCAEPFAQAELEMRKRLLEDIRSRMAQTLSDHASLIDSAVETLEVDLNEAKAALEDRLKQAPDREEVVDQAESAYDNLVWAIEDLQSQMDRIVTLQGQLGPRLEKYAELLKERDEDHEEDELDKAYQALPSEIREPAKSEWAKAEPWADYLDWEPWEFLKAWARHVKQNAEEAAREAYHDALARKPSVCNPYVQIARKAAPDDRKTGNDLLKQINDMLANAGETEKLESQDAKNLGVLLDEMDKLVQAIKERIAKKRDEARKIDDEDGGHSVKRHGPDVTDTQLQSRLKTGYSPDGIFSPAAKSCRFNSYDDLLYTREQAFIAAAARKGLTVTQLFGADLDQPPDPGNNVNARKKNAHSVSVDHGPRVIGSGFEGTGQTHAFPSGGQKFSSFAPLPDLTKTFTRIVWDGTQSRWVAIQHFPTDV